MQPELFEKRWKPTRYETVPGTTLTDTRARECARAARLTLTSQHTNSDDVTVS